jgi:hypothetical protein
MGFCPDAGMAIPSVCQQIIILLMPPKSFARRNLNQNRGQKGKPPLPAACRDAPAIT